jgi:hypothetical protein
LLLGFPAVALASQSLRSGSGNSPALPNSPPFTDLSNWRAEVRIHDYTFDGNYALIFGTNSYSIRLGPSNTALITSWKDKSFACSVIFPDRADRILRFQRDAANKRLTVEAWNASDGGGYLQASCGVDSGHTSTERPNDAGSAVSIGGFKGSLAYIRVYSSVVPLQTAPSNSFDGDLVDYELDGDGAERAKHLNVSFTTPAFSTTPTYSPAPVFGQFPASRTFAAGDKGILVDGSNSFTATDNARLKYQWEQIEGPAAGVFAEATVPATMFSAPLAGSYVLRLTVTDDSGKSGARQMKYGAVTVDSNGFVVTGNPAMDMILGPLTIWGTSPWPWFDLTEKADADALRPYQTTYPSAGTQLSGTVTVTSTAQYSPPNVVGTGTHFTKELKPGDGIAFSWPAPDGLTGQWRATVTAIADDTHLSVDVAGNPHPFPFTDVPAFKIDRLQYVYWGDNQNVTTNWNFYDNALALYRLYYRTGIDDYLKAARTLADGWYHYALDHGYNIQPPRYASLQGIIARAVDGRPEYWQGIMAIMNYPVGWNSQFGQTTPLPAGSQIEPRESGYALRWAALLTLVHPDATVRANWCESIANAVTNVWPSVQDDLGNFEEDVYNENVGYPYKAHNGRFGSSPWRGTIALLGLQQAYQALLTPTACNNPDAAASVSRIMIKFVDFIHDYGTGTDRGQLYSVGYETVGQDPLASQGFNQSVPNTTGTLSVTSGSVTVTGSGTNFATVFWGLPGAGLRIQPLQYGVAVTKAVAYIGIPAGNGCNLVLRVASVQSDTQLTLAEPWPASCPSSSKVTSGIGWVATWEGSTNCGSRAAYCEGGPAGDRNLTHDIHAAYLWAWLMTGDPKYFDWATDSLGADYGGPAGGPGTSGPGAGPRADGRTGNFADPLPVCGTPPCGGAGATNAMGKALGMSAGAGNATNAIALYTAATLHLISPDVMRLRLRWPSTAVRPE